MRRNEKNALERRFLNSDWFLCNLDSSLRKEIQDIAKQKLIQISKDNSKTLFLIDGHFMVMSNGYYKNKYCKIKKDFIIISFYFF